MSDIVNTAAIKKALTVTHLIKIFEQLKVVLPPRQLGDNLVFPTRCHNLANNAVNYKLYYYPNTNLFHCYTECAASFDIFQLIIKAKEADGENWGFQDALRLVMSVLEIEFSNEYFAEEVDRIDDWNFITEMHKNKPALLVDLAAYSPKVLEVFSPLAFDWNQYISPNAIKKFNIAYYHPTDRITIPHFDRKGRLIGIRGRAMRQEDLDMGRKYMPLIVENILHTHPLSFNLYGMWENKDGIKKTRKAIIFEAEKSVLQCQTYLGEYNHALAICGMNLGKYQRDLLIKTFNIDEVTIALDKQYHRLGSIEGKRHAEKVYGLAYKFAPYAKTYVILDEKLLDYKDSPSDKGEEIFHKLMSDRLEIKTKRMEECI